VAARRSRTGGRGLPRARSRLRRGTSPFIWQVRDPRGRLVRLRRVVWEQHIVDHVEMRSQEDLVRDTVRDPDRISTSTGQRPREVYERKGTVSSYYPPRSMVVLTVVEWRPAPRGKPFIRKRDTLVGEVITAYTSLGYRPARGATWQRPRPTESE